MSESRKVHVLTCSPGQTLSIAPAPGVDVSAPVGRFFADGDVDILIGHAVGGGIKLIVTAHPDLIVHLTDIQY